MIVVADTTPLLYLSRIGRLDIARALYLEVLIPREVHTELVENRPNAEGVEELRASRWIVIVGKWAALGIRTAMLAATDRGRS